MKNTKICFISTATYPLFNNRVNSIHGGAELQFYFTSLELSKDKLFDVKFIVGDYGQKDVEKVGKINLYKSINPMATDSMFTKIKNGFAYLRLFLKINPDVFYTCGMNNTIWITTLVCKLFNKKHLHRTASDMNIKKIRKSGFFEKLMRWGIINSDVVFVQNKRHQVLLKRNFDKNSVILKNLFYIKKPKIEKEEYILWVGRAVSLKRPELFLELAKKTKSYKFIIICSKGKDVDYWQKIKEKASKITNIKFIGGVHFQRIQPFFDKAKVFINTSDYEGFPNVFIQAGMGKTPIVSLNVNPDNFLDEYNCGYFCNNNFDLMNKKLKQLLTDKTDWKEKSGNCYMYVKENHNIKKGIYKIKKFIFNLGEEK